MFLASMRAIRPAPIASGILGRAFAALVPLALLGACTTGPISGLGLNFGSGNAIPAPPPVGAGAAPASTRVGILLPLTGGNAALGQAMLRSAQLALGKPDAPPLDVQDTGDAPGGAGRAAEAAVSAGDGILLGPLTSANTAEAAPVARAANVPMLAFTSDLAQAQPGVWVMGITPEQQVRRLVFAAKAEGRTRIAALLPDNALGNAMALGLNRACADAGLPPPVIAQHSDSMESINSAMRGLADFADRRGAIEQKVKDDRESQDPAVRDQAAALEQTPVPPPPFDALLLADTGTALAETISVLKYYDVSPAQVRIMGPGLWGAFANKLAALPGAWFAAPDEQDRAGFAQHYLAKFGQMPKPLADIPYDAAALARSLARTGGYSLDGLTRADGFAGGYSRCSRMAMSGVGWPSSRSRMAGVRESCSRRRNR